MENKLTCGAPSYVSTSFGTTNPSPNAFTVGPSSSSEASMQSGIVIFGASAGSSPEGWSSTAAPKGVFSVEAMETI